MVVEVQEEDQTPDVDLLFTKVDRQNVIPHDNGPVVISLVTAGRRVHRVLVDQGSSADVMFWSTFNKLQFVSRPVEALYRVLVWFRWRPGGGAWAYRAEDNLHGRPSFTHCQDQLSCC